MSEYCENPVDALRMQKVTGYRIQPHLHTSAELIYLEKGEVSLITGTLEYKLFGGDFAFIMPSMLHSIIPMDEGATVYTINCKPELIEEIIKRYSGLRPASPVLKSANVPPHLLYALNALASEKDKNIANAWIKLIITIVTSSLRFAEIHDGVTSELSSRVLEYLSKHYKEQISLELLSEKMGVSRFHLSHLFSNKLGIGFKEYLNNLKVECAKNLLRTTDIPVSDVCTEAGFENQRTFNRVFRENTGSTPRNYRLGRDEFVTPSPKPVPVTIEDFDIESVDIKELGAEEITSEYVETPIDIEEYVAPKPKKQRKSGSGKAQKTEPVQTEQKTEEPAAPKKKKKEALWLY